MLTGFYTTEDLPIKRGQKVRIPKGTFIHTTHPSRENGPSKATQVITVHHLMNGQGHGNNPKLEAEKLLPILRECKVKNPRVCWPGSGGYWCEADINEVEVVSS